MSEIRIAVCQLQCHPAIALGYIDFLSEPFARAPDDRTLSELATRTVDVDDLREFCRTEYLQWHENRIRGCLAFLESADRIPDLVLFPELSIPGQLLPLVDEWAQRVDAVVMAGTHGYSMGSEAWRPYRQIGIKGKYLNKIKAPNVLPLLLKGKPALIEKTFPSAFERSTLAAVSRPSAPHPRPLNVGTSRLAFSLLPVICSEALALPSIRGTYDVVGLVCYDAKPSQFGGFVSQQVRNQKIVAMCNEGRFGGSGVFATKDTRQPDWFSTAMPDGLPAGDAILITDVDLDATSVQMGVANPISCWRLVKLASVVFDGSAAYRSTQVLQEVASIGDPSARAREAANHLRTSTLTELHRLRLEQLRLHDERTSESSEWWSAIGQDWVLPGRGLDELEADLAATCQNDLLEKLDSLLEGRDTSVSLPLLGFLADCKRNAGSNAQKRATKPSPVAQQAIPILDRDDDVKRITSFFDGAESLLVVTGLQEIGKTCVIQKALAEAGVSPVARVDLTPTSSPEFLLATLFQLAGVGPRPPFDIAKIKDTAISSVFRAFRVVIVTNVHHASTHDDWRDSDWAQLLDRLVKLSEAVHCKLILESRRFIPTIGNPTATVSLRVWGLERASAPYAIALFDAQLRRQGLNATDVSEADKLTVVHKLGGHPMAVVLAANAAYTDGMEELLASLKRKNGNVFSYTKTLSRGLALCQEEETLMKLLCIARGPIPRRLLLTVQQFPAAEYLKNLISMSAVEVRADGWIEPASILRSLFASDDLPPELVMGFHENAAMVFDDEAKRCGSLALAVEAEFHGGVAGVTTSVSSNLADGTLASAQEMYQSQRYEDASKLLVPLLKIKPTADVLALAALVEARRNRFDVSLVLANESFARNPRNQRLLNDLAKIALTQNQGHMLAGLVAIARKTSMENENLLVIEARMLLRRADPSSLADAEALLKRSVALTTRNPWPFYYLGVLHLKMGDLEQASDVLYEGQEFCYERVPGNRGALNAIRTQLGLAYLLQDNVAAAQPIIEAVFQDEPEQPEAIRAFAALTIKTKGIQHAHEAFSQLRAAQMKSPRDRCQFHLFYGLFFLGIDEPDNAVDEFRKAHEADRTNVYVMMKLARTLLDVATEKDSSGEPGARVFVNDCVVLVRTILSFDPRNNEGLALLESLYRRFDVSV